MGMMSRKVTRRVMIGSAVVGLGGAPLVFHILKGRYQPEPLTDAYDKEWHSDLATTQVSIKKTEGPSVVVVNHKQTVGREYRAVSLSASYDANSHPAVYPQPPHFYILTNGRLVTISPILDDARSLSLRADNRIHKSRSLRRETRGAECVLVLGNDGVQFFEKDESGSPQRLPGLKVNLPCAELGTWLAFDFPKQQTLRVGMEWTAPETSPDSPGWPCTIVGYAEVAGRPTVEILTKRPLNTQQVVQYIKRNGEELKKSMAGQDRVADVDKATQHAMDRAIKEGESQTHQVTRYIDLQTGITLRQEYKSTIHVLQTPSSNKETIGICQLLES
jgi:hypothetical protein